MFMKVLSKTLTDKLSLTVERIVYLYSQLVHPMINVTIHKIVTFFKGQYHILEIYILKRTCKLIIYMVQI